MGNTSSHSRQDPTGEGASPTSAPLTNDAETESTQQPSEWTLPEYSGPPIGLAVLGTGQRARGLLWTLATLVAGDNIKTVIYDEAPEALEEAKRSVMALWGRSKNPPEVAESVEAAVNRPDIQWVMVTSKNYLHKDYCIAALEAGKHVFCEKPLATTIDDCFAIRDAAIKAGKLLMTGFVLRYSPFYRKARSLVEEGYLGKIITMEANEMLSPDHGGYIFRNWRRHKDQSGPHIMEKCAHDIDILNWMAGSIVTKVSAFGGNDIFVPENKPAADNLQEESSEKGYYAPLYRGWPAWEDVDPFTTEKTVEDNVVAVLQYRNGIRATFQTNCCSAITQRQLKIFGVEGSLDSDSIQGHLVAKRMYRGAKRLELNFEGGQHAGGDERLVLEMWKAMVHTAKQSGGGGGGGGEGGEGGEGDLAKGAGGEQEGDVEKVAGDEDVEGERGAEEERGGGEGSTGGKGAEGEGRGQEGSTGGGGAEGEAGEAAEGGNGGQKRVAAEKEEFRLQSSVDECFISTVTCLAIEEARVTGEVVSLEKYWERFGL